jgi:hypothetical protein
MSGNGTTASADPRTLLERWQRSVQVLHTAHGIAADRQSRSARATAAISSVLAAVVGAALILPQPHGVTSDSPTWIHLGVATLSLLAAALGVVQIVLDHPEKSVRHRRAYVDYGALAREMESMLAPTGKAGVNADQLAAVRTTWSTIEQSAPGVGRLVRSRARREVDRETDMDEDD